MKQILVIDLSDRDETVTGVILGQELEVRLVGCHGQVEKARQLTNQLLLTRCKCLSGE